VETDVSMGNSRLNFEFKEEKYEFTVRVKDVFEPIELRVRN
jgi:hypothetical protein